MTGVSCLVIKRSFPYRFMHWYSQKRCISIERILMMHKYYVSKLVCTTLNTIAYHKNVCTSVFHNTIIFFVKLLTMHIGRFETHGIMFLKHKWRYQTNCIHTIIISLLFSLKQTNDNNHYFPINSCHWILYYLK